MSLEKVDRPSVFSYQIIVVGCETLSTLDCFVEIKIEPVI